MVLGRWKEPLYQNPAPCTECFEEGRWTEIELSTSSSGWLGAAHSVLELSLRFNKGADIEISTPEMWFEFINEHVCTGTLQNKRDKDSQSFPIIPAGI